MILFTFFVLNGLLYTCYLHRMFDTHWFHINSTNRIFHWNSIACRDWCSTFKFEALSLSLFLLEFFQRWQMPWIHGYANYDLWWLPATSVNHWILLWNLHNLRFDMAKYGILREPHYRFNQNNVRWNRLHKFKTDNQCDDDRINIWELWPKLGHEQMNLKHTKSV